MTTGFRLDGRVALVTGVGGRLGPVWGEALLEAGATVVGLERPGAPPSPGLAALRERFGPGRLRVYEGDVRDRAALLGARDRIAAETGAPGVVVNNAGIDQPPVAGTFHRLEEVPAEAFRGVLDVNVLGAFQVMQVFGVDMVRAGRGSIVNIGSLYAEVSPDPRLYDHIRADPPFLKPPAYGASKAALVNLTRYFAAHWGPYGVRVNALSPGGVLAGQDGEFRRKFSARVPLGRMASVEDLGGPLVFLASEASAYVTGINLMVDGGFTAW